ncbi:Threonylcarbamoyladenosine tRNA methylthiotransferase [Aphelenchoides fujianensis]|nr:Threonylcarbamoyladenosine tRNA methylthiotransferase [Aphelenchoides fujianensis]
MSCGTNDDCDIEDGFVAPGAPRANGDVVHTKFRSRKAKAEDETPLLLDSDVPWANKKIWAKTWGCAHNSSDSEYMVGMLQRNGFQLASTAEEADLWLLNSCTTPAETQVSNMVEKARANDKKVVVAGCVSQAAPDSAFLKGVSIVGVQQIDRIVYVVEETLKGNSVRLLSQRRKENLPLDLPKVRRNRFIEILAINSGCLNHCTYCKTKQARGDLRSFGLDDLVARAKQAFVEGCKEIWLTSEDLGSVRTGHRPSCQSDSGRLHDATWNDNPQSAVSLNLDCLKEICGGASLKRRRDPHHPRVYSFLHVPVQSGSSAVLAEMKREYNREQFVQVVEFMREHVPGIFLATDFICAFPTETEEDFRESLSLPRGVPLRFRVHQPVLPPPANTPAARLKKIDTVEARKRTAEMTRVFHSYTRYTPDRVGEIHDVLMCELATDGVHLVGHNKQYEHILVPQGPGVELGGRARVRITGCSKFHMMSEVVVDGEAGSFLENKIVYGYIV